MFFLSPVSIQRPIVWVTTDVAIYISINTVITITQRVFRNDTADLIEFELNAFVYCEL